MPNSLSSPSTLSRITAAAAATVLAAGCVSPDEPALGAAEHALTCPVPVIDPARSLAVTDPTALSKFTFRRVMNAIFASAGVTNTPLSGYQDWMRTFAVCSDPAVDPHGYGVVCPRVEAQLADINPFSQTGPRFVPVALTNRFDLAPATGADCGEYRIVFALVGSPGDRALLIFEGRLPNPTPAQGIAGCTPVADFWAQLSTDPSDTSRAAKLEQLYFTGLVAGNVTFAPIVTAQSYGLASSGFPTGSGQIRTNMFVNLDEWQLREYKLAKACVSSTSCALAFKHVSVKVNPANELFDGTHANAPAFQAELLTQIAALSNPDPSRIAMSTSNKFNEFESVSQRSDVVYKGFTSSAFRAQIQAALPTPTLSVDNILDRATTQTCAGCHQLSNNVDLGDNVTWPRSLGFVHVDENRNLSFAMTQEFLPERAAILRDFLDAQCNGLARSGADPSLTLSGRALGAHH